MSELFSSEETKSVRWDCDADAERGQNCQQLKPSEETRSAKWDCDAAGHGGLPQVVSEVGGDQISQVGLRFSEVSTTVV